MFHVLVTRINNKGKVELFAEYDIHNKDYVVNYFIKPYTDESPIYIDGGLVKFSEIHTFKVCESEKESNEMYEKYKDENREPGIVYPFSKTDRKSVV